MFNVLTSVTLLVLQPNGEGTQPIRAVLLPAGVPTFRFYASTFLLAAQRLS